MRVIHIEDNPAARNNLLGLIKEEHPDIEYIDSAKNVAEGIQSIKDHHPDLVFLDIEMPDGSGFDVLQKVSDLNFQIIFISSHEKYALRAIKFSALDYILKPIDPEELKRAIDKAKSEIEHHKTQKRIQTLLENLNRTKREQEKLVLKDKYGLQIVQIKDIIHLEANGSYTKFYLHEQDSILVSKGLKDYENILSTDLFFRCHQSHLINIDHLQRFDKRDGDYLILKDGSRVPLATRKRERLLSIKNAK